MTTFECPSAVVGDIHGDAEKLRPALDLLESSGRLVIFVGDYINRGRETRRVLELLSVFRRRWPDRHVFLRGNHEQALLQWLAGGSPHAFIRHGGLTTISSYFPQPTVSVLQDFLDSFPVQHQEFLASTTPYFEAPGLLVSHAGYDPDDLQRRDFEVMVLGRNSRLLTHPVPKPQELTVFGHYVQNGGQPFDKDGLLCLDTGCGTLADGRLTILLLPERRFVQF
jgi:serine/threonine protein phosphatase 1